MLSGVCQIKPFENIVIGWTLHLDKYFKHGSHMAVKKGRFLSSEQKLALTFTADLFKVWKSFSSELVDLLIIFISRHQNRPVWWQFTIKGFHFQFDERGRNRILRNTSSCSWLMCKDHDYTTFFNQVPVWSLQDRYQTTIEVKMPLSFIVQADESFLKWYLVQGKSIPSTGYKRA